MFDRLSDAIPARNWSGDFEEAVGVNAFLLVRTRGGTVKPCPHS